MKTENTGHTGQGSKPFDTSTDDRFFEYYEAQSQSEQTIERFDRLIDLILKTMYNHGEVGPFKVADIGGGAGTFARMFARAGHHVTCVDISKDLLEVGQSRAEEEGLDMAFINCSATGTPLPDESLDICVVPELLEHVVEWQACLDEVSRILRPGGLLFLSTTNTLCPKQEEFNLPMYSWYPAPLKRRYERLALTTRPEVANYAKYPAVNWFNFYSLRRALTDRGFSKFLDRMDMIEIRLAGTKASTFAKWCKHVPLARLALQFVTDGSAILAFKAPRR